MADWIIECRKRGAALAKIESQTDDNMARGAIHFNRYALIDVILRNSSYTYSDNTHLTFS